MKQLHLLLIDDSEDDAYLLTRELKRNGYTVQYKRVDTAPAMRSALTAEPWDAIICDYIMPAFNTVEALAVLRESGLDLPFIVVSGAMGEETAVAVMRAGAHDYLTKDNLIRLVPAIEREMQEAANRRGRRSAEQLSLRLGHILDNSSNEIYVFDALDYRIIQSNRAACNNLGYDATEMSAFTIMALQPELTLDDFSNKFNALRQLEREEVVYETVQQRKDKSTYPVEVRLYLSTSDTPPVFVAIVQDITERKRSESAMYFLAEASTVLASTLNYDTMFEMATSLPIPLLADLCVLDIVQLDGSLHRAAALHIDPAKNKLVEKIKRLVPEGKHPIRQVIQSGQPLLIEKDLDEVRIIEGVQGQSYMVVPIIMRDDVLGAISFTRLESEHPYSEAELRLAEELARRVAIAIENARLYNEAQQALMLRDQFLSIAAHELKTPITALLGNTQLVQRRVVRSNGTFTERDQRMMTVIEQQAQRLARMVEALLDISRIRNGTLNLEREVFDLNAMARRLMDEMQPMLERHTFQFHTTDESVEITGDGLRLEQVFQNLIQNAVKYSPQGGQVGVEIKRLPDNVVIAVTDQGIGIPAKAIPYLFHQFYRAENTARHQIGGMGLGLFVVREIVVLHGGRVEVESVEGKGSTFRVYLPLAGEHEIARSVYNSSLRSDQQDFARQS